MAIQSLRSSACPHALCFGQQHEAGAGIFYGEITFFNTKSYMSEDKLDSNEEDTKIYDDTTNEMLKNATSCRQESKFQYGGGGEGWTCI